jgi:hypothetical protein
MVSILKSMKSIAIPCLLIFGAWTAQADLDLTPTQQVHTLERMPIPQVVFHDGAKEIIFQPPRGWTCAGSHNSAALSIPNYPDAKAIIQSAAHLRIPALDDKAGKLFQTNLGLLQLPKGAKDVKIAEVDVNPLVVDSHATLEVIVTYSFFGQACEKSILLVDRNGAEVSFSLDTLAADFKQLHTAFHGSIYSLENL